MALLRDDRLHVWFPRADLQMNLPAGFGGERLFGSDFAMDDLLALAGDPQRYAATNLGAAILEGVPCRRLALRPKEPRTPQPATAYLWISAEEGLPRSSQRQTRPAVSRANPRPPGRLLCEGGVHGQADEKRRSLR